MSLTKISDYIKLSKEDRQKHIDLTTECKFLYHKRDLGSKKVGDIYSKTKQMAEAKRKLLDFLDIEEFGGYEVHLCHLCSCDSGTDKVCINPAHLYFGTVSENNLDIPLEVRQKAGKKAAENMTEEQKYERAKIGGKKAGQLGITGCQQIVQCPHCGKEGSLAIMYRWHFDNCKHKPVSETLPDISSFIQE